ncbi:MAG: hypothetical protein R6V55_02615 [Desulfovermiculus sp.]
MIRYHLYISLSPHLYLTSNKKLKYSPKKMKPSLADRNSGKRVYLNRYLLMEEDSGCVYLEYARDDRPESLYPFLFIQLEAPPPGFRIGSSIFRQINLYEENFEDDGLWVGPEYGVASGSWVRESEDASLDQQKL